MRPLTKKDVIDHSYGSVKCVAKVKLSKVLGAKQWLKERANSDKIRRLVYEEAKKLGINTDDAGSLGGFQAKLTFYLIDEAFDIENKEEKE